MLRRRTPPLSIDCVLLLHRYLWSPATPILIFSVSQNFLLPRFRSDFSFQGFTFTTLPSNFNLHSSIFNLHSAFRFQASIPSLAMADWQELLQTVFIGLIFSYLVAKLISVVLSFKEDNLFISRTESAQGPSKSDPPDVGEADSVIAEHGSVRNDSIGGTDTDDDDDWEGVESTELDELFSAATAFVAASAADRLSPKLSNDLQLQLYGYYKIATEGPCSTPQPSALKMTARAKWYFLSFHVNPFFSSTYSL